MTEKTQTASSAQGVDVNDLIIERDSGARQPSGAAGKLLTYTALIWSLFQLWISSPLPFSLNIFIINDTEARSIHLAFAIFLAFTAYPTFRHSPRHFIPLQDWLVALGGAFCAAYLYIYYEALARRPGLPTDLDIIVAIAGIVILLEAARRSLGLPLLIVGSLFLGYAYFGSAAWMPDLIAHKGQSLTKIASHIWLSTEGVFGIALGVSTSFVFLFVLFGALLDKAGAGNYFIKVAFSLLGHLRGGPAKAAVLASGLTGFISGSSIANTVTTGTFTIPLMKRVGFTSEKAGAVEVSASVNGQIMPPVMGAAAFLMADFIGISYRDVIKHAFLPAVISYIALLYLVHLEALKAGMQGLPKPVTRSVKQRLIGAGIIISSIIILCSCLYFVLEFLKAQFTGVSIYFVGTLLLAAYLYLLKLAAGCPPLPVDNADEEQVVLPETKPTVMTGLYFIIPMGVLIWCLMVERLSPGLSAFWASAVMIFILLTQRPILTYFRGNTNYLASFREGWAQLQEGLISGARNMIGIGVATAAAGIVVGIVTLTGIGQIMTEIVEVLSGGSLILVLIFTAIISLILGLGLPTTANYIVVSSIMVGVVQELGAQHGLIVPLIAIHMFVFYFGIMADVTPPVGLASFAAAAISKGDPIKTGLQAFVYCLRTAILPFFFIFNTKLLLVDVSGFAEGVAIFASATIAILVFSAAMQGYFFARNKWHESIILLLISVTLFIPQLWMDRIAPQYAHYDGNQINQAILQAQEGEAIKMRVETFDDLGDIKVLYRIMTVEKGEDAGGRLEKMGLVVTPKEKYATVNEVIFNSQAEKLSFFFDDKILGVEVPQERPDPRLLYIPALGILMLIVIMQRRRNATIE